MGFARNLAIAVTLAVAAAGVLAASLRERTAAAVYVTEAGIGPDKWASVWLLRRHVDPAAEIRLVPPGSAVTEGRAFDLRGAAWNLDGKTTTFEQLAAALLPAGHPARPELDRIGRMLNEMEISRWTVASTSSTRAVETGFRDLQHRLGRETVPFACYMAYFDAVADAVVTAGQGDLDPARLVVDDAACAVAEEAAATPRPAMTELPTRDILARIARGDRVVFVDTREAAEYAEFHVPGAVNLLLRDVGPQSVAPLRDADLVVPYCVKDFRGYEVGRALTKLGVREVALMRPYGMRGWRDEALPVSGTLGLGEAEGIAALAACAAEPEACLK